jgi:hypothetical protein
MEDNYEALMRLLMETSSEEEEEEQELEYDVTISLQALSILHRNSRMFKWQDTRLNWEEHIAKLLHTGEFDQTYRMSYAAFMKLKAILGARIEMDAAKSNCSCPDASAAASQPRCELTFLRDRLSLAQGYVDPLKMFIVATKASCERGGSEN